MYSDHEKNYDFEQSWDIIADSFDKTRSRPWNICLDFINNISPDAYVIDIGCGNGRHLIPCAKRCRLAIGLDISRRLLSIAQKKSKDEKISNTLFIHGNATNIPLKDNSVDVAIYIATLHTIKGRDKRIDSLLELKRILKPYGQALISVWSRYQSRFLPRIIKSFFTRREDEFGDTIVYWRQNNLNTPRFYHLYSKHEFIKDIRDAGLCIVTIKPARFYSKILHDNYFIIIQKKTE
ncbi:MAG: class I SAM-dependent methyltransferase [Candidatus Thermoplasmatota archaeon]